MAKLTKKIKGMKGGGGTKNRGRTSITPGDPVVAKGNVPQTLRREVSRPITAGGGKKRGNRRDTSRTYTTSIKHSARGSNPRADVKTRKR